MSTLETSAPSEPNTHLVETLVALADAVARTTNDADYREAAIPLHGQVMACLQNDNDAEIEAALATLAELDVDIAFYALLQALESVTTRIVYGEIGSTLFVIPVVTAFPGKPDGHLGTLTDPKALTTVARAFKGSGLVSKDGQVGLLPYLYHPHELTDLGYAESYGLHHALVQALVHHQPAIGKSGQTGWPNPTGDEGSSIGLRFLVGFTLDDLANPVLLDDRPVADMDDYSKKLADFIELATDSINSLVGVPCMVFAPQLYFEGRRDGLVTVGQVALDTALLSGIAEVGAIPRGVSIVISPYMNERGAFKGLTVTAISRLTGDVICSHNRHIYSFEDVEAALANTQRHLLDVQGFFSADIQSMAPAAVQALEDMKPLQGARFTH